MTSEVVRGVAGGDLQVAWSARTRGAPLLAEVRPEHLWAYALAVVGSGVAAAGPLLALLAPVESVWRRTGLGQSAARVPPTRPDQSTRVTLRVLEPPVLATGLQARLSAGAPDVGCFHRRMRAGGSRRRGRVASVAWSIACMKMREHPERYPAQLYVSRLVASGLDYLAAPVPLLAEAGTWSSLLARVVLAGDASVEVTNYDVRPVSAHLALLWRSVR